MSGKTKEFKGGMLKCPECGTEFQGRGIVICPKCSMTFCAKCKEHLQKGKQVCQYCGNRNESSGWWKKIKEKVLFWKK